MASRRERLKPWEYIGFAGVIGGFAAGIILLVSRDATLAWIFGGVGFIVTLVLIATLSLAAKPDDRLPRDRE